MMLRIVSAPSPELRTTVRCQRSTLPGGCRPASRDVYFGSVTLALVLADLMNAMGSLAGVDLAISAYGEHKAQNWEMMTRSAPVEERYAIIDDFRKRGGFMKHWTGETVPLLIGHLPEKTPEQVARKMALAKRAVQWYFHLNSPFNHYLALKVADQMAHHQEFRQFMKDFVENTVQQTPLEEEENHWLRSMFSRRRSLNGRSLAEYALVLPYVVDKSADMYDRAARFLTKLTEEARFAKSYVMGEIPPHAHASVDNPPSEAMVPEVPASLRNKQPGKALTDHELDLLVAHMGEVSPPLNPLRPFFRTLYEQWLRDHPVTQYQSPEDELVERVAEAVLQRLRESADLSSRASAASEVVRQIIQGER